MNIKYLMNGVHKYAVMKEEKEEELTFIKDTLHNNEYNIIIGTRCPLPT
jgi:hypothetical protein